MVSMVLEWSAPFVPRHGQTWYAERPSLTAISPATALALVPYALPMK